MKQKWFNYRPLCLIFIFLLLGSFFAFHLFKNLALTISLTCIVFILILINAIIKKKIKYFLVPIIAFIVGVGCYHLAYVSYHSSMVEAPKEIQARIYMFDKPSGNSTYIEADNCIFDGEQTNKSMIIYLHDNSGRFQNIEIGSVIKFKPNTFNNLILNYDKGVNANLYYENIKYSATVSMDNIEYIETNKTFSENIKSIIKSRLANGLSNENVELAYSSLFGEKDMLSEKQYSSFKLSGVAHLLAVSGLHVGIIVGILSAFLRKLNAKRWVEFLVTAVFLLFYAYICNFAVSIIRASIMYLIMLLASMCGREYDSLNSISVAGIIIFFINPFSLFDISFIMSFSCVAGITILNKSISSVLEKIHTPNILREGLSISMSTSIALIFIMAYYFSTLNVISLIANVILIPLFTIAFVMIFICAIISIGIPFITFVLYPINYLLNFINMLANMLGNLPIANFATLSFNFVTILIYFLLLLLLSKICVAKRKEKIIFTLPIVALMFYCLV